MCSVARFARAPLSFVEGRWSEVRADARAVLSDAKGSTPWRDNALAVLGLLACAQGDADQAWALVYEGLPDGPQTPPGNGYFTTGAELQRVAAALAIESGDLAAARTWHEAHDRWLAWSGTVIGHAEGAFGWAAYYRATGDMGAAKQHAQHALACAMQPRQPLAQLAAHRLLGELETEAGRFPDAVVHLDHALALCDACQAPYERALTLLARADLHLVTRRYEDARHDLDNARAICIPLDARPALARGDALAARLAATARRAFPDGLTPREAEVLRLIARGRSNQEIAADLSMSVRTAERHISNIYGKVQARTRAEATAYAFHHDLT